MVTIFAQTECYSSSNLLVRSAMYRTLATYEFQAFFDHFSHKTYKHHASNCHLLRKQVKKSSRSKQSLKAKANHSLKIFSRINHHTGAGVYWQCQSCYFTQYAEELIILELSPADILYCNRMLNVQNVGLLYPIVSSLCT